MERKILIKDDLHPEDGAMLQALYSRSPKSVDVHLKKVEASGSGNFMDDYYVGYGHASIGDCGSTTIFVEGVSMLMAKSIQDHPLYSGQEASTRYMNFADVSFENPGGGIAGNAIQRDWMQFYHSMFPRLMEHFRLASPIEENEEPAKYERALKARTFDVLRGFIPAGAHTSLSWHTNLRQAHDKLRWLVAHPEFSTSQLASEIVGRLHVKYPHSGFDWKMSEEEWEYRKLVAAEFTYADEYTDFRQGDAVPGVLLSLSNFAWPYHKLLKILKARPPRMPMPPVLQEYGTIKSEFFLDFGSFRDLQRHRNGFVRMPLLTTRFGFHPWYLAQFPPNLRAEAEAFIKWQTIAINALDVDVTNIQRQSYIAMGFQVECTVVQSLPAFAYRVELRTSKSVHPTLRAVAQREASEFASLTNGEIPIHADMSPDLWDTRRGSQTIISR